MLKYENIEFLYALGILPALFVLFLLALNWRKRALKRFGEERLVKKLMPMASSYKLKLKFFIYTIAIAALVIGLANPQIGSKMEVKEGVDLMIAVDLSNSMLSEDLQAKQVAKG